MDLMHQRNRRYAYSKWYLTPEQRLSYLKEHSVSELSSPKAKDRRDVFEEIK